MGLIITLLIGCFIGWLAGTIFKRSGNGILMNIIYGLVGSLVGGLIFGNFFGNGTLGTIVTGTIGAILVMWIISLFKKSK
jgi:uncharacterized membrane protein YeaQ/YmgE (transglycosylase-associated protein family)